MIPADYALSGRPMGAVGFRSAGQETGDWQPAPLRLASFLSANRELHYYR